MSVRKSISRYIMIGEEQMKKSFLLVVVFVLLLAACQPAAVATEAPAAGAPLEEGMVDTTKYKKEGQVTIGVSYDNTYASQVAGTG
jgi:uncharacterized lipoprotein YajG